MKQVAQPINTLDWAGELERLADQAEALERNPNATLANRLDLATAAFSRLWLAWSPAVIATSCRASATMLEPLLVVSRPLDEQLHQNRAIRHAALAKADQLTRPAVIEPVLPAREIEQPAPVKRVAMAHERPPGWLTADEIGTKTNRSGQAIRSLFRRNQIPAEMSYRASLRSLWFDPAVIEMVLYRKHKKAEKVPT